MNLYLSPLMFNICWTLQLSVQKQVLLSLPHVLQNFQQEGFVCFAPISRRWRNWNLVKHGGGGGLKWPFCSLVCKNLGSAGGRTREPAQNKNSPGPPAPSDRAAQTHLWWLQLCPRNQNLLWSKADVWFCYRTSVLVPDPASQLRQQDHMDYFTTVSPKKSGKVK